VGVGKEMLAETLAGHKCNSVAGGGEGAAHGSRPAIYARAQSPLAAPPCQESEAALLCDKERSFFGAGSHVTWLDG
jgi:hypothetical protein